MTRDEPIFDKARWLHESQTPDDDDDLTPSEVSASDEVAAKRRKQADERAARSDRNVFTNLLREDTIPGYRVLPNSKLKQSVKDARAKSLTAAAERRAKRRHETGVAIHYNYIAWKKLGADKQAAFNERKQGLALTTVPETGRRWDFNRDFYWQDAKGDAPEHLNPLFRSGTPRPRRSRGSHPQQSFTRWYREGQSR